MGFLTDAIKKLINDPVYDDYYLYVYTTRRGDKKYSCVLPHADNLIFSHGLAIRLACGEIKSYYLVGVGSEDDIADLKYDYENN